MPPSLFLGDDQMSTVPVLYLNDISSDALGVWLEVAPPVVSAADAEG